MAVIKIEAKKDTRCTQTICLIRGDRRTQILRFGVNRFDGGVDLSDLAWVIKTVNANGVEDVFDPEAVEIGESRITVDWLVEGSVTDADGLAKYELNGLDTVGEDVVPVIWRGGTGTISLRADISPKFGESDGMTNIEKLILYVDGELQNVIDAGSAAADAAARANRAADNVEDLSGAVERANAAAQRATDAAAAVEDLEGAVTRANSAAALATDGAMSADVAASMAYSAATRATEAAKNVENIEEATVAAYDAADDARMAAEVANTAGLPAAMIYGRRVMGETAKATGNPVSFLPDAGSLLQPVTVLEPQQSGSGDPYPAGGGRNLLDVKRLLSPDGNASNINVTLTGSILTLEGTPTGAFSQIQENNTIDAASLIGKAITFSGILGGQEPYIAIQCKSANATLTTIALSQTGAATGIVPEGTTKIAIAACLNQSNYVGSACKATYENLQLEIGSSATEYQPWENIRPFIGYDKLKLTAAGKNLLPNRFENFEAGGISAYKNPDGSIRVYGTCTEQNLISICGAWENLDENIIGVDGCDLALSQHFVVRVNKADGTEQYYSNGYFHLDPGDRLTWAYFHFRVGDVLDYTAYPQIELGTEVTSYGPYAGKTHTVQIGQTVYGFRYEWLTGKLVAEWAMVTLTGEDGAKMTGQSGKRPQVFGFDDAANIAKPGNSGIAADAKSSHFRVVSWNELTGGNDFDVFAVNDGSGSIGFAYNGTIDEANAWLQSENAAGTPVQIAYKLATPIEIQLTPHIISAVDPEQTNTLYGDGTIEVEYVKPLHVSIEERVAAAIAALSTTE